MFGIGADVLTNEFAPAPSKGNNVPLVDEGVYNTVPDAVPRPVATLTFPNPCITVWLRGTSALPSDSWYVRVCLVTRGDTEPKKNNRSGMIGPPIDPPNSLLCSGSFLSWK